VFHHANEQIRNFRVGINKPAELCKKRKSRFESAYGEKRNKQAGFLVRGIFGFGCWVRRWGLLCFWSEARGGAWLRGRLQRCGQSKLRYLGTVDARVDGSYVGFVPLVLQVIIRWREMRIKVIKGNEVLTDEEGRSKV